MFELETRIGEHLEVVQFAAPPPIKRWAGVLGTVGWPGWLEEGRGKEVGGRVDIYRKMFQCQEL